MTASIAPTAAPSRARRTITRIVRGSRMALVLVQPTPENGLTAPAITFDQHADLIAKGSLTLAEAGALSAALDDLRAKAAAQP